MMSPTVIRFPLRLCKADRQALRRLEAQFDEQVVGRRIGPEGERQVRCSSGEIYNIDALRARRQSPRPEPDPLPPAPAAALAV